MRILFLDPVLRTAETREIPPASTIRESLPWNFAKALHDQGHEVVLVSCDDFRPTVEEEHPFRVVFLPARLRGIFPPRALPFMPGLWRWLRGKEGVFDLVVCGEIFGLHSLMAALACPGRTLVWHEMAVHPAIFGGWASRAWYALTRPVFSRVRAIVPRSANARRFLSHRFPAQCAWDVEHGVDGSLFAPVETKADRFVVVSQLVERKRVDQVLRAFAAHVRAGSSSELWVVGDGPSRSALEGLSRGLSIEDRCRFLGRRTHAEIADILAGSKALLYAGYKDNSLLTVAESVASGTPVLITSRIDNADLVQRLGLGIARDEWDETELVEMDRRQPEFTRACREHRREVTVDFQAKRLVEAFLAGNVPVSKGCEKVGRPKVVFLTQNCFAPCDTILLPHLKRHLQPVWKVFFPQNDDVGYDEPTLRNLAAEWGIQAEIFRLQGRLRGLGTLWRFWRLAREIRAQRPDIVYVNATGSPWLAPCLKLALGGSRVLWAVHDVQDHRDKSRWSIDAFYKRAVARWFGGVHLLSHNQLELYRRLNPGRPAYCAPIPPYDFGPAQGELGGVVRFLFFGFIARYKGVDLLIEAAQRLWEKGVRGFEVCIAGRSDDWESFAAGIRIPEIFRLDIRNVPNELLPRLYGEAHWVVLPYRDATQSGPLSSAIHYRKPAIVSDLPAFAEFVEPGTTGLAFASESVEALERILEVALSMGTGEYRRMCEALGDFADRECSVQAVSRKYLEMFEGFRK